MGKPQLAPTDLQSMYILPIINGSEGESAANDKIRFLLKIG
jgi:hypothetical protein